MLELRRNSSSDQSGRGSCLVEYVIERGLDLCGIHLEMIPHPHAADERFTPPSGIPTSAGSG
jgi:hypothetical protein